MGLPLLLLSIPYIIKSRGCELVATLAQMGTPLCSCAAAGAPHFSALVRAHRLPSKATLVIVVIL